MYYTWLIINTSVAMWLKSAHTVTTFTFPSPRQMLWIQSEYKREQHLECLSAANGQRQAGKTCFINLEDSFDTWFQKTLAPFLISTGQTAAFFFGFFSEGVMYSVCDRLANNNDKAQHALSGLFCQKWSSGPVFLFSFFSGDELCDLN